MVCLGYFGHENGISYNRQRLSPQQEPESLIFFTHSSDLTTTTTIPVISGYNPYAYFSLVVLGGEGLPPYTFEELHNK